jgi:hypothetical protein
MQTLQVLRTTVKLNEQWKTIYYCPICYCKCDRPCRLRIHLLRHSEASRRKRCHTCPICDRLFDRIGRLTIHIAQHDTDYKTMQE